MKVAFILDDHESEVTPLKTVEAIIESNQFSHDEIKEIIAYLSVYTRYNPPHKHHIVFEK
jgi:magnesium-transporting ATPase (P-type)